MFCSVAFALLALNTLFPVLNILAIPGYVFALRFCWSYFTPFAFFFSFLSSFAAAVYLCLGSTSAPCSIRSGLVWTSAPPPFFFWLLPFLSVCSTHNLSIVLS